MKGKFRILGRIGLGVFLVCALMVAFMPIAPVSAATTITDVWVEFPSTDGTGVIDDTLLFNKAASVLLWRIHFKPTTALKRGVDTIVVQFYDGLDSTMGPTSTQDTYDVEFGGSVSTAANYDVDPDGPGTTYGYYDCQTVSQAGYRLTVTAPVDIAAGSDAWLLIDDASGMITSGGPNNTSGNTAPYKVRVHTSQDTTPVLSRGFYHGTNDLTFVSASVSPSTASATAQYTFTFTPAASLTANTDTITVTFPYGTTVPSSISASSVTVYDTNTTTAYTCGADPIIDTDLRTVKVTVPHATSGASCYVRFATTAGITNPTYGKNDYGENDVGATTRIGFIRSSDEQLDIALAHGSGYTITEDIATTLDFDYSAAPYLVTGLSDKYTMINMYSSILYLQVEDQYGNLVDGGDTATAQVTLSSSSGTGNFYYVVDDANTNAYTQITGTLTLVGGAKIIYYRDSTAGTHTLTCTYTNLGTATQTMTVCPGASLYDRYDNLIHTYAPTSSSPVEETNASTVTNVYKGGKYVQQAIDAAVAYDKVVLGDGHYEVDNSTNTITTDEAYMTLKSLNGADSTTLDGSGSTISWVVNVTAANVTIQDLTVKGHKTTASCDGFYVRYGGFTFQNLKFIEVPDDNIFVESSAGAITSGTITNNTFTGIGPGSSASRKAICVETYSNNDISGVSITNNTVSNFTGYQTSGITVAETGTASMTNVTVSGNTITNCYDGIMIYGSPSSMTNTYGMTNNTITDCTRALAFEGGTLAPGLNFKNNTISGFTKYGVIFNGSTSFTGTDVDIQYNDITGTGTWGIYNADTSSTAPDCKYNWWGDATGPSAGTGTYASTTAQGSGEAVTKNVTFSPWLHKSLADVVADNASYQAVNIKLIAGWNTLSTPVKLISTADSIDELIPSGMDIGYYYDATGWHLITTGYVLNTCDAVYVKMSAITYVLLKFDAGAFSTPSKDLAVGWNLASLAYLNYTSTVAGQMNADDAVASVAKTAANLPGYAQVISPSMNAGQTDIYGISGLSWVYAYGETVDDSTATQKMLAGLGYWVYMQNAATLAGFEITPIAPDLD